MPQNLCCVTFPFAVLRIASFHSLNLTRGYKILKFLVTADYPGGGVLAERQPLHHTENVLKMDFGDIYRCHEALSHRLCDSRDHDAPVGKVEFRLPLAAFQPGSDECACRGSPDGVVIILRYGEIDDIPDVHVTVLICYATSGFSYCL